MSRLFIVLLAAATVVAACGLVGDDERAATDTSALFAPEIDGELLLASGFSSGTAISGDQLDINGIDEGTGFSWDDTPAWIESTGFYYAVADDATIGEFMTTEIIELEGPDGSTSDVLHLVNKGDDPNEPSTSRNELSFFGNEEGDTFDEGYVRYWTRLQPDLDQIVPEGTDPGLYYLMESKDRAPGKTGTASGHSGFRINIGLTQDTASRRLSWVATGEQVQPERIIDWQARNDQVDVPLGEWFLVEAYLRRHPTDGRVWLAVDGEPVFDLTVRTQHRDDPKPLLFWSVFKLYHDESWHSAGPTEQWFDDLELWRGAPAELDLGRRVQP